MKKSLNKSYIWITLSFIIICCMEFHDYKKPVPFNKTLNAIIRPHPIDNPSVDIILRETKIKINATMYINSFDPVADLEGTIIIDNSEYTFEGSSASKSNRNWFLCFFDKNNTYDGFILYNLNTIEIFKLKNINN